MLNSVAAGATCLVGVAVVLRTHAIVAAELLPAHRIPLLRATTWCVLMSLWPMAWKAIATREGCRDLPCRLGLFWPFLVMAGDLTIACGRVTHRRSSANAAFRIDPNALASLTFAIASLTGALRDPIRLRFFLAPALINILFVLPTTIAVSEDDDVKVVYDTAQRAVVTCSAALVVSGIVYTNRCSSPSGL